ncbi:hypothetical protein CDAR_281531 [Caerostris darwini]|uniref:Uncharacterized protein n=1 Tax=Caerostris darwini TaxID=1538125 RepID=A0AAV4R0A6_9ARAC|nr:hypothetical protein CDAR_281531 [Caerostris darwini]
MCSFRTGVALELFGQKMAIFSRGVHKMEFNQYFSKAEKRTETPVARNSNVLQNGKLAPYFQPSPPPLIQFRDPLPPRDSVLFYTSSLIFGTSGKSGSEDGSTSGHSEKLKV